MRFPLIVLVVLALVASTAGCAGSPGRTPSTIRHLGDTPDLHFEPHGLYGHINGGSELFLEFGFNCLDVHHVAGGNDDEDNSIDDDIDVEIYRMKDQAAALGIYLAKCGKEKPMAGVSARNTGNPYQITAVAGSVFLQVNNFSGISESVPMMAELVNEVLGTGHSESPLEIWRHLPETNQISGTRFLFRGQYALDPIFTFGEGDILQIADRGLGAGARYKGPEGNVFRRMTVVYENRGSAKDAMAYLLANLDSYIEVITSTETELVFKDYAGEFGHVIRADNRLDFAIKLKKAPRLTGN